MSSQHETAQAEPAAGQPAAASSSTTAARRGLRAVKSRVATPGAGVRARRNIFKTSTHDPTEDELAMNDKDLEAPVSSRSIFGRRAAADAAAAAAAAAASKQQARPAPAVQKKQQRKAQAPPRPADADGWAPAPPQRRKGLWGYIKDVGQLTRLVAMAITLIVLGALAVRVFVLSTSPPELYSGYRMDNRLHWYGRDWRSNLRQFVPYVLIHPLGAISDEDFAKMNGLILAHANEVAQVKHMQRLNSDSLERINRILPAVVHMELDRRGRPVITQEFWHALKDSIQADRDIFTLIQRTDGSLAVSDLQWTALKHQLEASGMLPDPKAKALSVRDVETIAETTLSKSWEAWLRRNQNKVRDILGDVGPEPGTAPFSPLPDYGAVVEQLSDEQLATLARKMASSDQAREVIVSRKDFLQILQNSFVEHRVEIKGELADLEARVIELARTAASAVSSIRAIHPSGLSPPTGTGADNVVRESVMSRQEIMNLVDRLVRKGVSDAQLEAMARGKIKADWSRNLINQVNFFTINSGAAFNHHFSSPSYSPFKPFFWRRQQGGGGHGGAGGGNDDSGRGAADARLVPGSLRGSVAFEQWEQDGDCWCAATTGSNTGSTQRHGAKTDQNTADIAIKLGLRILPQYFVVEHINPSATLDPGAMPKDLEVWVQITEYNQRQLLQDWSSHHFPDTNMQNKLQGWGFVKIGAFTYESPTLDDGESQSPNSGGGGGAGGGGSGGEVQVFRLSPDLETLDIVTDHIVVRALTNYGDTDHTCFYRLRLYGKARPDVVE
ncbi:spindle pole body-associated protein sad1 [Niveomyces insectorum RCEF 264]|uniref:Spindle pole body-associated protein sad1 n=1 Tax=Niveomyces insectorum RCEF 264 TaxID=1081102 RepID=A0A167YWF9_9HYPO|nr:spindle pole body-associated protein sad1 [Niveomyces insectorum RCEF 264]